MPVRVLWIVRAEPRTAVGGERFLGRAPDGSVDPYMRPAMAGCPVWTSKADVEKAIKQARGFLAIPTTYDYFPQEIHRHGVR